MLTLACPGVHIFQFDPVQPDSVAVNVYCIEDENFEELKVRPHSQVALPDDRV